jgi:hypothetical protein
MAKFARLQGAFFKDSNTTIVSCIILRDRARFSSFDNVLRINPRDSERHPLQWRDPKEVLLKLIQSKTVIHRLAVTATKEISEQSTPTAQASRYLTFLFRV